MATTNNSINHASDTITLPSTQSLSIGTLTINGYAFVHAGTGGNDSAYFGGSGNFTSSGDLNTAVGHTSLGSLTGGSDNTAIGYSSLSALTDGIRNSAFGNYSLETLDGGSYNCSIGLFSGEALVSGSRNTFLGTFAGSGPASTESDNIYIGYDVLGDTGVSNKIQIGTQGSGEGEQNACQIAGIYGNAPSGTAQACYVDTDGTMSSRTTPSSACSFFAFKTSAQTISAATTSTITFGSTAYNNGTVFASNTFTAPTSGKLYYLHAHVSATSATITDKVTINVNGVAWATSQNSAVAATTTGIDVTCTLVLTAADAITVTYTNSAGAVTTASVGGQAGPGTTPYLTWFEGYQIN